MRWSFLIALGACHGGRDTDTDLPDTDDTDVAVSLREGDACDPDADLCGGGTLCCTRCCRSDTEPVCTAPDAFGTCPLPDITVDAQRLSGAVDVQDAWFDEGDCAIVEGCVGGSGWRRLLKFATTTPNRGTADLHFGNPGQSDLFEWSECHEHSHFTSYAEYRLFAADGTVAAAGHKQAFCLMDYEPDPSAIDRDPNTYDCSFQGISVGWQDTYDAYLDCQWIDVTGVAAGDYVLEVELNVEHVIAELDYSDDLVQVPVVLLDPEDEPPVTTACTTEASGRLRNCGWDVAYEGTCTPGEEIRAGCGACAGDPVMRVCDGTGTECRGVDALLNDDDGFVYCPIGRFTCPESGAFTVLTGSWYAGAPYECDVSTEVVE